jgi:hypothetical protein
MIYGRYGQPVCLRLENQLQFDGGYDRMDFGSPEWGFLTAQCTMPTRRPKATVQPNHKPEAYEPGDWCDNQYMNFPAGNDSAEMQSFFWFHDHFMHHTGANVYKGMVALYPIYDPTLEIRATSRFGLPPAGRAESDHRADGLRPSVRVLRRADGRRRPPDIANAHNGCG